MLSDEKILKLISLILLNIIIVLPSSFVFSNLAYAQFLNDKTLEGITHYSPTEYPHINVGKRPVAIGVNSNYREDIHLVYVVDSKDDIVSIIDGINNTNTRNDIKVGNKPVAIGVNNFTNTIYVANSEDNTVTVIDGINNTRVKDIPVGGGPFAIGVNNFTNTIYVANYKNNTVSVINGKYNNNTGNDIKVGDGPNSIGVDEFTHTVYVANFKNNTVTVIDGLNNTRVKDIPVGDGPNSIGVDEFTHTVYVANFKNNTVTVIDGLNNTRVKDIPVGDGPNSIGVDEFTDSIYVTNSYDGTVSVINGSDKTNTGNDIEVGSVPNSIGVDSLTDSIYVTHLLDGAVSVIDSMDSRVVAKVIFGMIPFNAGHIECNKDKELVEQEKLVVPIAEEFYIWSDAECTAIPNQGFQFVSWQENIGRNSTHIIQFSSPSSIWDSFLEFINMNPDKPEAKLKMTKFGTFTANFKALPPPIPPEYLIALFGIVAGSIVGWLSPTIINSLKLRKEAKIVSKYHYAIKSLYNENKIDEHDMERLDKLKYDIDNDYAEGKIGDKQYENTKNEISILYEKIFRKMINSMENLSDKEVAKKQFNGIAKYIDLVYSEGKLSELHYNLLMKRFPNFESL